MLKQARTRTLRLCVVLTIAAAVGFLAPATAEATPTGCSTGTLGPDIAWAQCQGGTGQYYVRTLCVSINPFQSSYWKNGPWRSPNGISYADCGTTFVWYAKRIGYVTFSSV